MSGPLQAFTSLYDAITESKSISLVVTSDSPAHMLLTGAERDLTLAEELLAAQDATGALKLVENAMGMLVLTAGLGEEDLIEEALTHAEDAHESISSLLR